MNSPEGPNFEGCGFKVGDIVVCIEENEGEREANYLYYGRKYIVEAIEEDFGTPEEFLVFLQGHTTGGVFAKRLKKVETKGEITMEQTAERIREDILHIEKRIEEAKKDITSMEEEKNALIEKLKEKGFELIGQKPSSTTLEVGDRVVITGYSPERHVNSHIGRKGVIEKVDDSEIPFKIILEGEDEYSNTWFQIDQIKKI